MGYEFDEFFKGVGCRRCRNTGYSGRIGIHEVLVLDDEIRDAVTAGASLGKIRDLARGRGMVSLRYDGFRKVREGITTVEEILHATGDAREPSEVRAVAATV